MRHPAAGTSSAIEMNGIAKWYGQVVAVNGVSLNVRPGVTGLLGPNGAGKSTLMKILTGQLRSSRGRSRVCGHDPWNNPEMNRILGFCPEQDTFYEWMTGRRFVQALLSLNGYRRAEVLARSKAAINEVGMSDVADGKIAGYSKGMRQRIKLAQAIAHDPEVLILDEPVTGLDPIGRRHIIDLVRRWGEEGRTVLVSSHILHEVEAMTSTVLLINHGRLLAEGDVHEIRDLIDEHPHHVTLTTSDPRSLAARLIAEKDVVSVRFDEHSRNVTAETIKPDAFYARIPSLVLEEGVIVDELSSPDDNLQAVFNYLVH
ncbi:MAG: ABC transporter ATP-binding protein [Acidobacteriota bacterium]